MNLTISKQQLKYIACAVSNDSHRKAIQKAALMDLDGSLWCVSTDTYRIHAVKLGSAQGQAVVALDTKRALIELAFHKLPDLRIGEGETPGQSVQQAFDCSAKNISRSETIFHPLLSDFDGKFPDIEKVIPKWEDLSGGNVCGAAFNFSYITDGSQMARTAAYRVVMMGQSDSRPWVILPRKCKPTECEWFTVIMPMSLV